jgi:hypothetical protein
MRLNTAWAQTAIQNITLKWATASLSFGCLFLTIGILRLSLRDPVIVERACYSQVISSLNNQEASIDEMKAFLLEVLSYRFDSDPSVRIKDLSMEEQNNRNKEQELLKQKQMSQKILINKIEIQNQNITIDADRIISIGKAKTILPFPLKVEVQKTQRSEANPYGLILTNVSPKKEIPGDSR